MSDSKSELITPKAGVPAQPQAQADRLEKVRKAAFEVFGEDGEKWICLENRALGGVTPLSLLETDDGCQQVLDVLGRISYGVYS